MHPNGLTIERASVSLISPIETITAISACHARKGRAQPRTSQRCSKAIQYASYPMTMNVHLVSEQTSSNLVQRHHEGHDVRLISTPWSALLQLVQTFNCLRSRLIFEIKSELVAALPSYTRCAYARGCSLHGQAILGMEI